MKLLGMGTNPTNITTTSPALAVNTYPTYANSFELQGRSLVLNQWAKELLGENVRSYGVEVTTEDGVITAIDAVQQYGFCGLKVSLTAGHKFFLYGEINTNNKSNVRVILSDNNVGWLTFSQNLSATNDWQVVSTIVTVSNATHAKVFGVQDLKSSGWDDINVRKFMLIDLTQMYDAGMEPTAVAQVKVVIGDKYISYNPGTFIHNNATYEVNKWNQLCQNGDFSQGTTGWTDISVMSTWSVTNNVLSASWLANYTNNGFRPANVVLVANHKYYATATIKNLNVGARFYVGQPYVTEISANAYISQNTTTIISGILAPTTVESSGYYFTIFAHYNTSASIEASNIMCIDLTDIFGAGKEPLTVDECKLRFLSMGIDITKYQPYSPLGGQYCGYRNIWDEEWEVGGIHSSDGEKYDASDRIRSKNIIPCLPNTSYYFQKPSGTNKYGFVYFYDANKVYISYTDHNTTGSYAFETPSNAHYMNFVVLTTTTYNKNDISIYQVSNKVDLGFNIWDEEWDLGTLNSTTGEPEGSSNTFRTRNFIPILPNTNYCFTHPKGIAQRAVYYDINKNFVSYVDQVATNQSYTVIHTPANAYFYKFFMYETTYNHDICINLSQTDTTKSPHNGDYRPYLMLRGIGSDFNVWDEQWEVGSINATTGALSDSTTMIRSKNEIRVLPSTTYYFQIPSASSTVVAIHAYNANGTWLGMYQPGGGWITSGGAYNLTTQTFTTPSSAAFLRFRLGTSYGTTYKNNICINLSQPQTTINPHNGQYVPHLFDTYDSMSGILTRRIGVVDLGTLDWDLNQAHGFTAIISNTIENCKNAVSDRYIGKFSANNYTGADMYAALNDKEFCFYINAKRIFIKDTSYSNAATFKSAMNGVMLLYELATPTVETTIIQPISFVAGKLGKLYGVIDLGSLSWTYDPDEGDKFFFSNELSTMQQNTPNVLCGAYHTNNSPTSAGRLGHMEMKVFGLRAYLKNILYTNASAFKNSLQGQYLIYELADGATDMTYATAGNLIRKTNGDVGDVDFNLKYWEESQVKLIKVGNKFLAVSE